jgi:large subunit ribosomal protein L10e
MTLRVVEQCQIRHIALEAARISANRFLAKMIGNTGYHLKIRVFPHNVLRENKIATGAGADRISEGMRAAFGKPIGTAARVHSGQKIMTLETTQNHFATAKLALKRAAIKLPSPCYIEIERGTPSAA